MSNFYIKGMSTSNSEMSSIFSKFNKENVQLINVFNDYSKYAFLSKEKLLDCACEKIVKENKPNSPINLICHSMGCNFGVLIPNRLPNVNRVVMVSPEIAKITAEEKSVIEVENKKYNNKNNDLEKLSYKKIKSIILYLKSRNWANEEIESFLKKNIKTLLVYSKGDVFVSQEFIHDLATRDNVTECGIFSNSHNPILLDQLVPKRISQFNM